MSVQEIESLALRLPLKERARLAQQLIASLDEADELAQAWTTEAARRSDALASGVASSLPSADVFAEARRAIA